jgi:hypothetical protein
LVDVLVSNPEEIVNGIDEGGYDGYNIAACQEPMGLAPGQSCTISFYFAGVGGSYFPGYPNTWSTSLTLEDNASSPTVNWTVFMPKAGESRKQTKRPGRASRLKRSQSPTG